MPGPPPKNPATRRNRRHVPGQTTLTPVEDAVVPEIPARPDGQEWTEATIHEWDLFWKSPMAQQVQHGDAGALMRYMDLVDLYWRMRSDDRFVDVRAIIQLAAEIRLEGQSFGLTPLDRWRLKWEITQGEEAEHKRAAVSRKSDPRSLTS